MRNSLWREESKVLEKTPGELLIGRLARRLMIVLCRSPLEAADMSPGSRSCMYRSAEGRGQ